MTKMTNNDTVEPSSIKELLRDEKGMSTIEYAMGSLAAAALAAVR